MAQIDLGNVVGAAGKSAYQSAKDGGYTGTEASFNTRLANAVTTSEMNAAIAAAITNAIAASY